MPSLAFNNMAGSGGEVGGRSVGSDATSVGSLLEFKKPTLSAQASLSEPEPRFSFRTAFIVGGVDTNEVL